MLFPSQGRYSLSGRSSLTGFAFKSHWKACDMLGDMVYPDFLDMPPCLTPLGEQVMDAVCQDHIDIDKLNTTLH
jgi:hypothetical protein